MEEFINAKIEFGDKQLDELCNCLSQCYNVNQFNFARTSFVIYSIWDYCKNNYWLAKDNEWYNANKVLEKFGFDKKAVSRYKQSYEKYVQGDTFETVTLKSYFNEFSPSKLFELLTLSYDTLENAIDKKLVRPDMTVKQIREYIKSLKDGTDKAEKVIEDTTEINEDDIPLVYDPKQEYEYSYFESKTKNQLLNIVWELQKAYQKLKGEKKNVKQSNK